MLFMVILIIASVNGDIVRWAANAPGFLANTTTCSKQTLIFPTYLRSNVKLDSDISLTEIELPLFGDLILGDMQISFGPDESEECDSQHVEVHVLPQETRQWSDPGVWASMRFNEATPDAERVPCHDDTVVFAETDTFQLDLPENDQFVKEVTVNGVTGDGFHALSAAKENQLFNLNTRMSTGLLISLPCILPSECPCQKYPLDVNCNLKECPKLTCAYPVKPIGSCCEICGGVLAFTVSDTFVFNDFKKLVEQTVESYGDNLVYHIGRIPHMVQLVVVDKANDGTSSVVVSVIDHQMKSSWKRGFSETLVSGSSIADEGFGGKIVVSMFLAVVLVMGGIYVYYYKPGFWYPLLERESNLGRMRFESRTDSVVTLARRDSCADNAEDTSFRNPMFDLQNEQSRPREVDAVEN